MEEKVIHEGIDTRGQWYKLVHDSETGDYGKQSVFRLLQRRWKHLLYFSLLYYG